MMYLIAGGLLGAAVAILTLPWSRRDPAEFSRVELGYAWRGPRGAVIAALHELIDAGVARRSRRRGIARGGEPLPRGLGALTRAVYGGIGESRRPSALLALRNVQAAVKPVASHVMGARLRVGAVRRALGTVAAVAAPVIAFVTVARGAGDVVTGLIVGVVALAVAWWLVRLRGITLAGARTMAAALSGDDSSVRPATRRIAAVMAGVMVAGDLTWADDFSGDYGGDHGSGGDSGGGDSSSY